MTIYPLLSTIVANACFLFVRAYLSLKVGTFVSSSDDPLPIIDYTY